MALNIFEMVLGIVVIGSVAGVIQQGIKLQRDKIRARRRGEDDEAAMMGGVVEGLHKEVARLKERVRVLEKLVTDDDRRLSDEIDRLRRSDVGARP